MRKFTILILLGMFVFSHNAFGNDTSVKTTPNWYPDYAKFQFAGNIGFLSAGFGYQFLNNRLYSEILYGYVPASISNAETIHTITIKNTFPIINKTIKDIIISPITGFTASFETGNNSFLKLPDKYPEGYYITNAFHFTFFIGSNIHKNFTDSKILKGTDIYFELGSVESYLLYAFLSKEVKLNHIFSSAIGINLYY